MCARFEVPTKRRADNAAVIYCGAEVSFCTGCALLQKEGGQTATLGSFQLATDTCNRRRALVFFCCGSHSRNSWGSQRTPRVNAIVLCVERGETHDYYSDQNDYLLILFV